jgi:hypothetical protein
LLYNRKEDEVSRATAVKWDPQDPRVKWEKRANKASKVHRVFLDRRESWDLLVQSA